MASRFADIGAVWQALHAVCLLAATQLQVPTPPCCTTPPTRFKHFVLTRPSAMISGAAAIVSNGYGEMRYGEQKYGGME